jgi:hypothetical protein
MNTSLDQPIFTTHQKMIDQDNSWVITAEEVSAFVCKQDRKKNMNALIHHRKFERDDAPKIPKFIDQYNSLEDQDHRKLVIELFHEWFGIPTDKILRNGKIHIGFFKTQLDIKHKEIK